MQLYQYIDGLVYGAFGNDVLDPGLVHVHGAAVLEDGARCMEVLRTVHLVGTIEEEVSRLVSYSWGTRRKIKLKENLAVTPGQDRRKDTPRTSADFFLSMIWMSHDPSGI